MAYRMNKMTMLRVSDKSKFVATLRASITKHHGMLTHVAQDLDIGLTTLKRWVKEVPALAMYVQKSRKTKV